MSIGNNLEKKITNKVIWKMMTDILSDQNIGNEVIKLKSKGYVFTEVDQNKIDSFKNDLEIYLSLAPALSKFRNEMIRKEIPQLINKSN